MSHRKRAIKISFWVNEEELKKIDENAELEGRNRSSFLRFVGTKRFISRPTWNPPPKPPKFAPKISGVKQELVKELKLVFAEGVKLKPVPKSELEEIKKRRQERIREISVNEAGQP